MSLAAAAIAGRQSFAIETTLSGSAEIKTINDAIAAGYSVTMTYVAVKSAELSVLRVLRRAFEETRTVAQDVVLRRYPRSLANLAAVLPRLERLDVYDNRESEFRNIARLDRGRIISATNNMPAWAEHALREPLAVARDRAIVSRAAVRELELNRPSAPAPEIVEEDVAKRAFVADTVLVKSEQHIALRTGAWSYAVLERRTLDREPALREHVSIDLKNRHGHLRDPGAQAQDRSRKRPR